MNRWTLRTLPVLLAAALWASAALAAPGDHLSNKKFSLFRQGSSSNPSNTSPAGIAWDSSHLRVIQTGRFSSGNRYYYLRGYAYQADGTYDSVLGSSSSSNLGSYPGITWDGSNYRLVSSTSDRVIARSTSWSTTGLTSFGLTTGNNNPSGITWDGALLRVIDSTDDKVYSYTASGTYTSSADFDLADSADLAHDNGDPTGITWDGTYYRVVDSGDDKVYSYTATGTYTGSADFGLARNLDAAQRNSDPTGITWDGTNYRVVDSGDDKVYSYEGITTTSTPPPTYGLTEDNRDYAAAVSSTVTVYNDWKCLRSTGGKSVKVNNATLTVHGFCVRRDSGSGIEAEIHLPTTAKYADLKRFADVTGHWWVIESGIAAQLNLRIFDDSFTTEEPVGALAFTETRGGLEPSDRLGFPTMAKLVTDADCAQASGAGFACARAAVTAMGAGDTAALLFSLADWNDIELSGTPPIPESVRVTRDASYRTATLTWKLYGAVTEYEIQRLTAVIINVADASRIEYGDPVTFTVTGTQAGLDRYVDATTEAQQTHQYRIRARGASITSWTPWTEHVSSGAEPQVDLAAPSNLQLSRDSASIMVSWSPPSGALSGYTIQRQELVVAALSTFFGNIITLGDPGTWLPRDSTVYRDTSIVPTQLYEYRVAAVVDNLVGIYSDWFRIGPPNTSLGQAPTNIRRLADGSVLDDRREFWMAWDTVPGADDYEVQLLVFDVTDGRQATETHVVTDPMYFHTAYGRVELRVRGRKHDETICAASPDDRCVTEWSAWGGVRFTPKVVVEPPPKADDSEDASVMKLRNTLVEMFEELLSAAGSDVNGELVLEFLVLVTAVAISTMSIGLSWKRGMIPLGVGMGAAILILILFAGHRLFGTPVAWAIAVQVLVAVAGLFALVRQTGVFR